MFPTIKSLLDIAMPLENTCELFDLDVGFVVLPDFGYFFNLVRRSKRAIPATMIKPMVAAIGAQIVGLNTVKEADIIIIRQYYCRAYRRLCQGKGLVILFSYMAGFLAGCGSQIIMH